ncbi:hypothetical protein Trydic_g17681 [Trypoxylus dichotomus]
MAAPAYIAAVANQLLLGKIYRRKIETADQRLMYLRDRRLTGDPYVLQGLEAIDPEMDAEAEAEEAIQDVERDQCPADFAKMSEEELKGAAKDLMDETCKEPK